MSRPGLRALIYNRASSDPTGQAVSVSSQDVENRAWCTREGWTVVAVITDNDRSATRYATRERDGYALITAGLHDGRWGQVDVLVMWESSRGERTLDGHVVMRKLCETHRMLLAYKGRILNMADGDDRFTAGLDALLDEREAERARDRILRSHRGSVAAGKPRGFVPYGYAREYDPVTRRLVAQVPDPETAAVVAEIVRLVLAGDTLWSIAQSLNDAGIPTPRERMDRRRGVEAERAGWSGTILRHLLSKRSLMGMRTHHGEVQREGTWEPIVTAADWQAVQAVLADPDRIRHGQDTHVRYLLSGIAECGPCGAWLRPFTNRGRPTYRCDGIAPSASKGHVSRRRDQLDAVVTVALIRRLADPHLLRGFAQAQEGGRERARAVEVELADLRARLVAFELSASSTSGIEAASFARVLGGLAVQIAAKEAELGAAVPVPAVVVALAGPDARERWDSPRVQGDIVLQRQAVRALLRVVVGRSSLPRGSRAFDASTVVITSR